MDKLPGWLIAFAGMILIVVLYQNKTQVTQSPIYISENPIRIPPNQPELQPEHPAMQTINVINTRNEQITNINYPHVNLKVRHKISVSVKGNLVYEKKTRFRAIFSSIFAKETDIGSNDEVFWFWSKRMDNDALYYARHEDAYRSGLKTPFHPVWLREMVGIDIIDTTNATFEQTTNGWKIYQNRTSTTGEPIIHMTLVDEEKILGRYIYSKSGTLIASFEVKNFYYIGSLIVPKTVHVYWSEENIALHWELSMPILNSHIDSKNWIMPDIKTKIDLGID